MTDHEAKIVYEDEKTEYWVVISAYSHQQAAEVLADLHDCTTAEYTIVGGQSEIIWVREKGKSEIHKFTVSGENERIYNAEHIE